MRKKYDTRSVSGRQSFDFWQSKVCSDFLKAGATYEGDDGTFNASFRANLVGSALISELHSPRVQWQRGCRDIRQDDKDIFILSQVVEGHGELVQFGRRVVQRPGDFVLYDSAAPLDYAFDCRLRLLRIPRAELLARIPDPQSLAATAFGNSERLNPLVSRLLAEMMQTELGSREGEVVGTRLAHSLYDMVAAFFDLYREAESVPGAQSRLDRIERFALSRLDDPDLDAETLAGAGAMSVRSLTRLFAAQRGTSPMKWLWARRLELAARLLKDDPHMPITQIALSCGFSEMGHFSRRFRDGYGCSPSEYRRKG